MTSEKLMPCPFCGGPATINKSPEHRTWPDVYAGCSANNKCPMSGRPLMMANEWNRRPSPPPAEGETPETALRWIMARMDDACEATGIEKGAGAPEAFMREILRLRASQPVAEGVVAKPVAWMKIDANGVDHYLGNDSRETYLGRRDGGPSWVPSYTIPLYDHPAPAPLTPENVQAMIDAGRDEPHVETYASTGGPTSVDYLQFRPDETSAPAPEGGTLPPEVEEAAGQLKKHVEELVAKISPTYGSPYWVAQDKVIQGLEVLETALASLRAADLGRGAVDFHPDRLPPMDAKGYFWHPDLNIIAPDESVTWASAKLAARAAGFELTVVEYMEWVPDNEMADVHDWPREKPEGEGWRLIAKADSEDGPIAVFIRAALPSAPQLKGGEA